MMMMMVVASLNQCQNNTKSADTVSTLHYNVECRNLIGASLYKGAKKSQIEMGKRQKKPDWKQDLRMSRSNADQQGSLESVDPPSGCRHRLHQLGRLRVLWMLQCRNWVVKSIAVQIGGDLLVHCEASCQCVRKQLAGLIVLSQHQPESGGAEQLATLLSALASHYHAPDTAISSQNI